MATKSVWNIVTASIKEGETTAQVLARIMKEQGTVEDVAALANTLSGSSALSAIKSVAARHHLVSVCGLINDYEQVAARYWASMC
ncbi:hypothetical protein AB0C11_33735 [Streptomyces sp. NPDC039016]|uniref:hypothetical protein n=1 Tax=Streptomyces sp. NPDC039016 TaxID=3154330 RepID=UPI0033F5F45F